MNKDEILTILLTKSQNIHYAHKYINFIFSRLDNPQSTYTENHHILPKAKTQFPDYANLTKYPWNNIKLTGREHFIAHWLLWKSQGGFMAYAFKAMKRKSKYQHDRYYKISSRVYEQLKMDAAKAQSNRVVSDETRLKISKYQKNKPKIECPHCHILTNQVNVDKWHMDNCKILTGIDKHSITITKTNKTKNIINPLTGLNVHQQCGINQMGDKNPSFAGYYILGDLKFSTKTEIAIHCNSTARAVDAWCKKPYRIIGLKSYRNSSYLQSIGKYEELHEKTYSDLGFGFEPITIT